jgi:hypothetical protein
MANETRSTGKARPMMILRPGEVMKAEDVDGKTKMGGGRGEPGPRTGRQFGMQRMDESIT